MLVVPESPATYLTAKSAVLPFPFEREGVDSVAVLGTPSAPVIAGPLTDVDKI
jgi:hypothetical protein